MPGRWVFEVANSGTDNQAARTCITWYRDQQQLYDESFNIDSLSAPCPCNIYSALVDERFFYLDEYDDCAYSLARNEFDFYQVRWAKNF